MKYAKILFMLSMTISGTFCKVPVKASKTEHDNNTKIVVFGYTCLGITLAVWHLGDYFVKQEEARIKELAKKKPLKISPLKENIDLPMVMKVQKNITQEYRRMIRRDSEENFREVDSILNSPVSPLLNIKKQQSIPALDIQNNNELESPELLEMRSTSLENRTNTSLQKNKSRMSNENLPKLPKTPLLQKSKTSTTDIHSLSLENNNETKDSPLAIVEDSLTGQYIVKKKKTIGPRFTISKNQKLTIKVEKDKFSIWTQGLGHGVLKSKKEIEELIKNKVIIKA